MLLILIASSLLAGLSQAGITDLNCTHMVGGSPKYAQSAVNCNNRISDAACLVIYTAAVKVDDDTDRDAKCAGNPVNPALVQGAIDICPKTCGYCCLTPAFMCEDKRQPRIPCSSVTQDMCESIAWRSILEEDCPKTCGLCTADDHVLLLSDARAGSETDFARAHSTLMRKKGSTVDAPAACARK
ncbi:unnamed protein product [Haemonchus placei]|uniref:ShTK domain protein n=1 Tax=Haemonchus placei TaxID=6290 RepID=A0A0N4WXA8_HAEPC|nr:unnamed protein product [Haemonchus placei]